MADQSEKIKRIREAVAREYYEARWPDGFRGHFWEEIQSIELYAESEAVKECYAFADGLSPKLSKLNVAVLAKDQTLPEMKKALSKEKDWHDIGYEDGHKEAQQEILNEGWAKFVSLIDGRPVEVKADRADTGGDFSGRNPAGRLFC